MDFALPARVDALLKLSRRFVYLDGWMDFVGLPVLLLLLLLHRLLLLPLRSGQCVKDMQPGKENRYQFTRLTHTIRVGLVVLLQCTC